jgi:hypothetical protein
MAVYPNPTSSSIHPIDGCSVRRREKNGTICKIIPSTLRGRQCLRYSATDSQSLVGYLSGYHPQAQIGWQDQLVSDLHRSY